VPIPHLSNQIAKQLKFRIFATSHLSRFQNSVNAILLEIMSKKFKNGKANAIMDGSKELAVQTLLLQHGKSLLLALSTCQPFQLAHR
jgi:hypothetical protein